MSAAVIVVAMAMSAFMAIVLCAVTVYVVKLHGAYDKLVNENVVLQLENTGMEAEIDQCHMEIDNKNIQISRLLAEKFAANAEADGNHGEF